MIVDIVNRRIHNGGPCDLHRKKIKQITEMTADGRRVLILEDIYSTACPTRLSHYDPLNSTG